MTCWTVLLNSALSFETVDSAYLGFAQGGVAVAGRCVYRSYTYIEASAAAGARPGQVPFKFR